MKKTNYDINGDSIIKIWNIVVMRSKCTRASSSEMHDMSVLSESRATVEANIMMYFDGNFFKFDNHYIFIGVNEEINIYNTAGILIFH